MAVAVSFGLVGSYARLNYFGGGVFWFGLLVAQFTRSLDSTLSN